MEPTEDWHAKNANFNDLIKQLFHAKDSQKREKAARQIGFLKDGRSVNLLCRALRSEKDSMVINRIIEALGRIGDARATLRIIEKFREELDKPEYDKLKLIFIIESLKKIKDKRALVWIAPFLNSQESELKKLVEETFNIIEPKWRKIIEKNRQERDIKEIFNVKM